MLARANRLVRAADYRNAVRRGRRSATANFVSYTVRRDDRDGARFGFIVAKTVGNAVTRNLVRRRLKAVTRGLLDGLEPNADIVIRAMPGSAAVSGVALSDEISASIGAGKG